MNVVPAYKYIQHMLAVPTEARRRCQSPWILPFQAAATGYELVSSSREDILLRLSHIFSPLSFYFNAHFRWEL